MYLNVTDAARLLGVSKYIIRKLAKRGDIPFLRISKTHFVYDIRKLLIEKENNEK